MVKNEYIKKIIKGKFSALFWLKALIILPPRSLDSVGFTYVNLDVNSKIKKQN
jgi:hypothetical protein